MIAVARDLLTQPNPPLGRTVQLLFANKQDKRHYVEKRIRPTCKRFLRVSQREKVECALVKMAFVSYCA